MKYAFAYERFEPTTDWAVRFFTWRDTAAKTLSVEEFALLRQGAPVLTRRESRLGYMWYRPAIAGLPPSRFAAEAMARVDG